MIVYSPDLHSLIRAALREDLGRGDLTTRALIPRERVTQARIVAKAPGVLAGTGVAAQVFKTADRRIRCTLHRRDGRLVTRGQTLMTVQGPARSILIAERTALNFLGHLSGIATLTHRFVTRVTPYPVVLLDTRKTLPGLRALEKYAVRMGGGQNHRLGLYDAVLIKTNHLKAMESGRWKVEGGKIIPEAIRRAKQIRPKRFVQIEVTNLTEFNAALEATPDAILLDNWRIADIRKAVSLRNSPFPIPHSPLLLEVSGGVTLANIRAIAATGVERISIGALTHSAPALDLSLQIIG